MDNTSSHIAGKIAKAIKATIKLLSPSINSEIASATSIFCGNKYNKN